MHGDFSKYFQFESKDDTRVLLQQGRPITDADWNTQSEILLARQREFLTDFFNWHGTFGDGLVLSDADTATPPETPAPSDANGGNQGQGGGGEEDSQRNGETGETGNTNANSDAAGNPNQPAVAPDNRNATPAVAENAATVAFSLSGHYYVDGLRCDFSDKPTFKVDPPHANTEGRLVYLEVWEEAQTHFERPEILEPRLAGLDTAWRGRIRWSLQTADFPKPMNGERDCSSLIKNKDISRETFRKCVKADEASLTVELVPPQESSETPVAAETGIEDEDCRPVSAASDQEEVRIYRIEIHQRGEFEKNATTSKATLKWSRENGSKVHPVTYNPSSEQWAIDQISVPYSSTDTGQNPGNWLELFDNGGCVFPELIPDLPRKLERPLQSSAPNSPEITRDPPEGCQKTSKGFVRVWDHDKDPNSPNKSPTIPLRNGLVIDKVLKLSFSNGLYRKGDYWFVRIDGKVLTVNGKRATIPPAKPNNQPEGNDPSDANHQPAAKTPKAVDEPSAMRRAVAPLALIEPPMNLTRLFRGVGDLNLYSDVISILKERWLGKPKDGEEQDGADGDSQAAPENGEATHPPDQRDQPQAFLSEAGLRELRRYVTSPEDITRQILARYLKFEPHSPAFRRWLSTVSIRELVGESVDPLLRRLERTLARESEDWVTIESDARIVFRLANNFSDMIHQEYRHKYWMG